MLKVDAKMVFFESSKTLSSSHNAYPFERQAARTWLFLHEIIKRNHVRIAFNPPANTGITLLSSFFAEYLLITSWPSLAPHVLHLSSNYAIMLDHEDSPSAAWDKQAAPVTSGSILQRHRIEYMFLGL